jgi:hypothetical protein
VYCDRCGQKSNSCSDWPEVQWLEIMINLSSWYCNCSIKSICKFLLIIKNLFFLDIKECNVYVPATVIEKFEEFEFDYCTLSVDLTLQPAFSLSLPMAFGKKCISAETPKSLKYITFFRLGNLVHIIPIVF